MNKEDKEKISAEEYYKKNRDKLRAYDKKRYVGRKEEIKKYRQKPEVKARINASHKTQKFKAHLREYRKRADVKAKRKEYLEKNREKINTRAREYSKRVGMDRYYKVYRGEIRQGFLSLYKKGKSCAFCGYNKYLEILQFHHKDKKEKSFNIANKVRTVSALKMVKAEVDKCVLLCPNCHAWLHFNETIKRQI